MSDTTELRRIANQYTEWVAAGCPVDDVHDTYPIDLWQGATQPSSILPLLDALEQQAHAAKVASDMAEIRERVIAHQKDIIRDQAAQIEALRADAERMRQLLSDARSALDYHQEQTRPIHSTRIALSAIDAALRQEQPHG